MDYSCRIRNVERLDKMKVATKIKVATNFKSYEITEKINRVYEHE